MFNRKNIIWQFVGYVAILFCGLSPSYATETMTYYAFVMYKAPSAGSAWDLPPQDMRKLKPGSYRFQIVRLRREATLITHIALRGEFEFVSVSNQWGGGVKLSKQETLDSNTEANITGSFDEGSLWLKTPSSSDDSEKKYTWKKAGQPWVQPLIDEMTRVNQVNKGEPVSNLMRFLVLKKQAKSDWQTGHGKKYTIYRLNYFSGMRHVSDEYLEAFSRFINPSHPPTTNIDRLKKWIDEPESFKNAGYLGQADARHKEFYDDFYRYSNEFLDPIVKNRAQKNIDEAEKRIEQANSQIAKASGYVATANKGDNKTYTKEQWIEFANKSLMSAENDLNQAQAYFDKAKGRIEGYDVAGVQKKLNDAHNKIASVRQQVAELNKGWEGILLLILFFLVAGVGFYLLVVHLFTNSEDRRNLWGDDEDDDDKHSSSHDATAKRETQKIPGSSDGQKNVAKKPQGGLVTRDAILEPVPQVAGDNGGISSPETFADYVLKNDLDRILEGKFLIGNMQELQNNDAFNSMVAQIVKEQVHNLMVKNVDSTQEKRPELEASTLSDSSNREPIEERIEERITVELGNELRAYLESYKVFDEKLWLALWRGDPGICELAKRLLLEYQPLIGSSTIENYDNIAAWLEKASGKLEVYLIIPTLDQECDLSLHEIVDQRIVKGAVNRVLDVKRPGLRCENSVQLKAQVVSS